MQVSTADPFTSDVLPSGVGRTIAALLVAVSLPMAAIAYRNVIVGLAPRAAILFETVNLPVNLAKLEISRTSARLVADGERRFLIVEGEVTNMTAETAAIPGMQVSVRSNDRQPLYVWTTKPSRQKLAAGEHVAFSARLASPPEGADDVVVEFDRADHASRAPAALRGHAGHGSSTESQYK